ncbi:PAS domain S-box protein [Sunxiuqinia rutila]|uniref:PAS domain S-box protein n=1 Tax=Sunxiuqinia rutila TaxID=1397841 RepID=UPI003D35D8A2
MITDLLQNATLLITLTVSYSFLFRTKKANSHGLKLVAGLLFGSITIIGMNMPVNFQPGIFFDGRSIILSLVGLFGGTLVTAITAILAIVYRIILGGIGVLAGTATIIVSALIGLAFRRYLSSKPENISPLNLLAMGFLTHLAMLLCQFILPWETAIRVVGQIWWPILLIFPGSTLLIGLLLRNEHKRIAAENHIRESEARYRTTLSSIGDAVITTDNQGLITFINPEATQLTGWSEKEAIGQAAQLVFRIIHEDTGLETECPVEKVINQGKVVETANHSILMTKSGRTLPVADNSAPIRDEKGSITGVVLVFRDQTEANELQQQLQKREHLFHTLTDQSPVGIFRTRPDGDVNYINPKCCELSGLDCKKALGRGWLEAIHPEDRSLLIRRWENISVKQMHSKLEYRFLLPDGRVTWVLDETGPELSPEGKLLGYIGTVIDITERKEAEKALLQSRANFQQTMDESPFGMRIVSNSGETRYVNQALLSIYGFKNIREYFDTPLSKRYSTQSIIEHEERKQKRKRNLFVESEYDIEILHKDGELRNLRVYRKLITWDGQPEFLTIYQDFTEQKKAQDALIQSEQSLKEAQEIARMGHWKYDLVKNETYWSENCYRLFGLTPFEVLPTYDFFRNYILKEDLPELEAGEKRIMESKQTVDIRFRIQLASGEIKWLMNRVIPEFKDNKLVKLQGIIIDITETKRNLDALKESEKGYKNLFKNDAAIKLLIDIENGNIADANRAAREFYGYSRKQLKQMSVLDIFQFGEGEFEQEMALSRASKNRQREYQNKLADGTIREVEVFISKIRFKGRIFFHAIVHDITGKKEAENQLLLLSKSTEQSPAGIVITDHQGIIEYINPKFTEITGYQSKEVIGKTPAILKSGYHSKEFYAQLWQTILDGKEWRGEIKNRKKNGQLYWESATISSILDAKGEISHFVEAKEDITEKKKILADLQLAKEKAEESDRLKTAFLANMSHEIRTPLNAILGFSNMLVEEQDLDQEAKKEFSSILKQSGANLLQIINDILDLSKLETGQLAIYKDQFDLIPLLKELHSIFKQRLAEQDKSHIQISFIAPEGSVKLYTDKVRFNQVFMNLLSNAVKFTFEGKIQFGIMEQTNETISFFVTDTGIGINKETQTSIFDRFRQADDSYTRNYGGTGLGLPISKKIIDLMGGSICLKSEVGKGTTFTFHIPLNTKGKEDTVSLSTSEMPCL